MVENEIQAMEADVLDDGNIIRLKKPLKNGKDSLVLDYDRLTGYTLVKCERAARKDDKTMTVPLLSQVYLANVAAVAAGVKYDDILGLSAIDFQSVTLRAQGFLTGSQD